MGPAVAIPFGVLALIAFLYALSFAYSNTFGAMLQTIIKGIKALPAASVLGVSLSVRFLATPFEAVDNAIRAGIGAGIKASEAVWNYTFGYVARLVIALGDAIAGAAEDTYKAIDRIGRHTIPSAVVGRVNALRRQLTALAHRIDGVTEHAGHVVIQKVVKIERVTVAKAAAVTIPLTLPRIRAAEHDLSNLWRRIKDASGKLAPAALVGAVVYALAKIGLSWSRCSNVNKTGKQLCGMNTQLLESLLADTLLIVGTVSLVEFAEGMQDITAEVVGPIRDFWRAT